MSIYGLGEMDPMALSSDLSMGQANSGVSSPYFLNLANPAAHTRIVDPLMDFGYAGSFNNVELPNGRYRAAGGNFRNFNYGFRLGKRFGMAFGLKPFSDVNYNFTETNTPDPSTLITSSNFGEGGFNNVSIGLGAKLVSDSLNSLSLGATGYYLFGNSTRYQYTLISTAGSDPYNSRISNDLVLRGFMYDAGILYKRKLNKNLTLGVGGTYRPEMQVNANSTHLAASFTGTIASQDIKDTVSYASDTGKAAIPARIGAGVSFEIGGGLLLSADFKTMMFSNLAVQGTSLNLSDQSQFAFGLQWIPDRDDITKFFKVMRYRVGARVTETGKMHGGSPVSEVGITFGLGIPIVKSQSLSTLNIGFESGTRSNGAGTYNEQFNNIYISATISPHKFDRWFVRRKID